MKKFIWPFFLILFSNSYAEPLKKIAIIGGGMSGVATGAFLKKEKFEIHLFEKEQRLGGHVRTFPLQGANGRLVNVDVGPQYINPDGWAIYVDFLKYWGMFNLNNFYRFDQTMTIFNEGEKLPNFVTPGKPGSTYPWLKGKEDSVTRLFSMFKFMRRAHQFTKMDEKPNLSLQEFLDLNKINKKVQKEVILPLISTGFTAPIERVGETSITTVSGVIAFNSPIKKQEWFVSKAGLQPFIEAIAKKTQKENSNYFIHLATPVSKVTRNENGTWKVVYGDGKEMDFDIVVFSTHVPVVSSILKDFMPFKDLWADMPYTYNKVVIHTDRNFIIHPKYPAFYNIKIRKDGVPVMGMNLQMVSPDFGPLIKTWGLTQNEYENMKKENKIVAESDFMHPLQTTKFLDNLKELKRRAAKIGNIYFTGGWSMEYETQFNAVKSGFLAAREIAPSIEGYWKNKMPSLWNY